MVDRRRITERLARVTRTGAFQVVVGTLSGAVIILLGVVISALIFGAYGWGLFVLTPFVVGFTTGYLVNLHERQTMKATSRLVLVAAALGYLGLILFALEGLICLLLASPLAALFAIAGGYWGRRAARAGKDSSGPLYCLALLPAMFAADAASPPSVTMLTDESIVIEAAAPRVWQALTSQEPIRERPTLAGRLGLAYPERAALRGTGVGATRTGYFSTGQAQERITHWQEGRVLGFLVLRQPPAMEEMSPHRRVYAPHLDGYFETGETRFEIRPLTAQRTRLSIRAAHRLAIDPVVYWEPIARWAVQSNTHRVLRDMKMKAEGRLGAIKGAA